jgi:hypothetical protein
MENLVIITAELYMTARGRLLRDIQEIKKKR